MDERAAGAPRKRNEGLRPRGLPSANGRFHHSLGRRPRESGVTAFPERQRRGSKACGADLHFWCFPNCRAQPPWAFDPGYVEIGVGRVLAVQLAGIKP
jgi:hypothetical protein